MRSGRRRRRKPRPHPLSVAHTGRPRQNEVQAARESREEMAELEKERTTGTTVADVQATYIVHAPGSTPYWLRSAKPKENGRVAQVTSTGSVEVEGETGSIYWVAGKNVLGQPQPGSMGTVYGFTGNARGRFAFIMDPAGERWNDAGMESIPIDVRPTLPPSGRDTWTRVREMDAIETAKPLEPTPPAVEEAAELAAPSVVPEVIEKATDLWTREKAVERQELEEEEDEEEEDPEEDEDAEAADEGLLSRAEDAEHLRQVIDQNRLSLLNGLEGLREAGWHTDALAAAMAVESPARQSDRQPPAALPVASPPLAEAAALLEPLAAVSEPEPQPLLEPEPSEPDSAPVAAEPVAAAAAPAAPEPLAAEPSVFTPSPAASDAVVFHIPELAPESLTLRDLPAPAAATARILVDNRSLYRLLKLQSEFMQLLIEVMEPTFMAKPPEK